jgi:Ca2+-binding RTX toxin-like protein
VTHFVVTAKQTLKPGLGTHTVDYVGDTSPAGGFLLNFRDLSVPIEIDLAAGTGSATGMSITGLQYANYISATLGNDVLKGSDIDLQWQGFIGNGGNDTINGRGGTDYVMYDDEEDYYGGGLNGVVVDLAKGTAKDSFGDNDTLSNIEGVVGTSLKDKISGDSKGNLLVGQEGQDTLIGGGGKDTLIGGNGMGNTAATSSADGRDTLTGGGDKDVFVFIFTKDSGPSASKRDYITDFQHGTDDIDLSLIDANTTRTGNQVFKFDATLGTSTTAIAKGHIGWYQINRSGSSNDRTVIMANTDGDSQMEMHIELKGLIELSKGDFIL